MVASEYDQETFAEDGKFPARAIRAEDDMEKRNESENKNKICAQPHRTYACGEFENGIVCVFDRKA